MNNPNKLIQGQLIRIPKTPKLPVVIPQSDYGYYEMMDDLDSLAQLFPFLRITTIGKSEMGLSIPAIGVGRGPKEIHYNASFHANEWITTLLLMKFLELYAKSYKANASIGTFIFQDYSIKVLSGSFQWSIQMVFSSCKTS